jgi:hypothetical protein
MRCLLLAVCRLLDTENLSYTRVLNEFRQRSNQLLSHVDSSIQVLGIGVRLV